MRTVVLSKSEMAELCAATMFACFRACCAEVDALVAEAAYTWDALPASFDYGNDRWIEAEAAIDRAAKSGNLELTTQLCDDYRARVARWCAHRRAKKQEAA